MTAIDASMVIAIVTPTTDSPEACPDIAMANARLGYQVVCSRSGHEKILRACEVRLHKAREVLQPAALCCATRDSESYHGVRPTH